MKVLSLMILSLFTVAAQADYVECVTADRTSAAAYLPESMTFEFVALNSTGIPTAQSEAIVGEPKQINPAVEYIAVWAYQLANGHTMEITWSAGQSEILRNIRTDVIQMEYKNPAGEVITAYANCRWQRK